ncbi:MAG: tetratricopeptide repeat protein [Spirochaetales bacterium]|nr:tetratricopeptide repeat protein [Spirochaetales bacterium]
MRNFTLLFIFFLIMSLFCCSSVPEQAEEVVAKKNSAAEYAGYGNNYYNQGMYVQALHFFALSLAYNGAVYHEAGMIQSYNSIGKVYIVLGSMEKAEKSFTDALELAMLIKDAGLIAQSINNLGELYLKQDNYDLALEKFTEALSYVKNLPIDKVAIIYHNMGIVYKRKDDTKTALDYFKRALKINLGKNYHEEIASNYYMISSIYSGNGDYKTALTYVLKALEEDRKVENSLGIAKDFQALGIIVLKTGKEDEAYNYFQNSLYVYTSLKKIYPNFTLAKEIMMCLEYLIPLAEKMDTQDKVKEYRALFEEVK